MKTDKFTTSVENNCKNSDQIIEKMDRKIHFLFLITFTSFKMIDTRSLNMPAKSCSSFCQATKDIPLSQNIRTTNGIKSMVESDGPKSSSSESTRKKEKFFEIGDFGLSLKTSVDQQDASQETSVRASTEDNSQLTVSKLINRQQSNNDIEDSDLDDAYIAIQPSVST
ncbi:uncharacterized protein LOC141857953 [Brevipalpus obovatus]|uniref:uncharacterized protein LOC141857953 n=1 Tax=Brevipalpus obovatus TaxID=246614 RepID=UPI003D9F0BC2